MVALALRKTCGTLFASVCERRVFRLIYYLRSLFVEAGYMLSHTHRPTDQGGKGGLLVAGGGLRLKQSHRLYFTFLGSVSFSSCMRRKLRGPLDLEGQLEGGCWGEEV